MHYFENRTELASSTGWTENRLQSLVRLTLNGSLLIDSVKSNQNGESDEPVKTNKTRFDQNLRYF